MSHSPLISNNINKPNNEKEENISNLSKLFIIKKYYRNGLLEKKEMKTRKILNSGKWTQEEHSKFIQASLKYGCKWKKLKLEIVSRTHAQIRSHAQKYFIKLCKKYNIEIKSKRKDNFTLEHLNFPYKRKSNKNILSLDKINSQDLKFLKMFNFYDKKVDLNLFVKKDKIFLIKKVLKEKINNFEPDNKNFSDKIIKNKNLCNNSNFSNFNNISNPYNNYTEVYKFLLETVYTNRILISVLGDFNNYNIFNRLVEFHLNQQIFNLKR